MKWKCNEIEMKMKWKWNENEMKLPRVTRYARQRQNTSVTTAISSNVMDAMAAIVALWFLHISVIYNMIFFVSVIMKCEQRRKRREKRRRRREGERGGGEGSSSDARTSNYSRHGGKPSLNPACIITSYNSHMHSVYSAPASGTTAPATAPATTPATAASSSA